MVAACSYCQPYKWQGLRIHNIPEAWREEITHITIRAASLERSCRTSFTRIWRRDWTPPRIREDDCDYNKNSFFMCCVRPNILDSGLLCVCLCQTLALFLSTSCSVIIHGSSCSLTPPDSESCLGLSSSLKPPTTLSNWWTLTTKKK